MWQVSISIDTLVTTISLTSEGWSMHIDIILFKKLYFFHQPLFPSRVIEKDENQIFLPKHRINIEKDLKPFYPPSVANSALASDIPLNQ